MKRIDIKEVDNTRPGNASETNVNIPYIPGMVNEKIFDHNIYYTQAGAEPDLTVPVGEGNTYKAYNTTDKRAWEISGDSATITKNDGYPIGSSGANVVSITIPHCDLDSYRIHLKYDADNSTACSLQDCDDQVLMGGYLRPEIYISFLGGKAVDCDFIGLNTGAYTYSKKLSVGAPSGNFAQATFTFTFGDGAHLYVDGNDLLQATSSVTYPINTVSEISYTDANGYGPFQANEPIECPNEDVFVKRFGESPAKYCDTKYCEIGTWNTAACDGAALFAMDGESEKSYIYARELSHEGLPVLYEAVAIPVASEFGGSGVQYRNPSVAEFYSYLVKGSIGTDASSTEEDGVSPYTKLNEKGNFDIKYLTTGGYPSYEYGCDGKNDLTKRLIDEAYKRGDCVAIIDHTNNYARPLSSETESSVFGTVNGAGDYSLAQNENLQVAAMFTPWANYRLRSTIKGVETTTVKLPASFGYFRALAQSIRSNPDYLAIAGVARGNVPGIVSLNTQRTLTNSIADSYQTEGKAGEKGVSINAITNIRPYGLTIWGNRTLLNNSNKGGLTAHSFLNTRNMVSNIKKILFAACQSLMFEQNSDVLWVNFLGKITPTLDNMQYSNGLSRYKILRGKYNPVTGQIEQPRDAARMYATIKIWPLYAIEAWDITVILTDEDVEVE